MPFYIRLSLLGLPPHRPHLPFPSHVCAWLLKKGICQSWAYLLICLSDCAPTCPPLNFSFPTTPHLVLPLAPPMLTCSVPIHLIMGTTHRGPDDRGHEGSVPGLRPGPGRGGCRALTRGVHGLPLLRGHHRLWALDILPKLPTGCPRSPSGEVLGGQVGRDCGSPHRAVFMEP